MRYIVINKMELTKTINWNETIYWNNMSYGKAYIIPARYVKLLISFICVVTPATNWLIPIIWKRIKDIKVRCD